MSTANDKEIVPPAPVGFFGTTFSPDGTELYYAIKQNLDAGTLYRVPVLGGTPVKVLEKIDGPVSFSPDGKQFVLVRANYPQPGQSALVIANTDGSGEHDLAVIKNPRRLSPLFFTGPSWSPDGKIVASTVATQGGSSKVVGFSVADGSEKDLSPQTWPFSARVQWLPDMSGLLVVAGENPAIAQIWVMSYPDGTVRRVTNDLIQYRAIGMTQDGTKFTTVQAHGLVNLWVAPEGDAEKAVRLPTGNVSFYSSTGNNVTWTRDGRLVFISNEGGTADIWIANPDGTNRKQLTANGTNFAPVVSSDDRYVVFVSWREGRRNLWRIDHNGSNPNRLTSGLADGAPSLTPDGRWIFYTAYDGVKPELWKVSIDGGAPVKIIDHVVTAPSVSPDGKWIAYTYPESSDPSAPPNRIAIIPIDGGPPVKTFSFTLSGTVLSLLQWAPDGKSVLYTVNANNVSNVWRQSIDGGPPKQMTDFKEMLMVGFAWSRDGKQLACTRGNLLRDAILITDLK